jgi:hypothetical protein
MKKTFSKFQALIPAALAAAALWTLASPAAAQQGVSKDEILVGSIQDLSGPLAGFGKQARNWACNCGWTRSTSRAASTAARSSCSSRTRAMTRRRPCWPRRSW